MSTCSPHLLHKNSSAGLVARLWHVGGVDETDDALRHINTIAVLAALCCALFVPRVLADSGVDELCEPLEYVAIQNIALKANEVAHVLHDSGSIAEVTHVIGKSVPPCLSLHIELLRNLSARNIANHHLEAPFRRLGNMLGRNLGTQGSSLCIRCKSICGSQVCRPPWPRNPSSPLRSVGR